MIRNNKNLFKHLMFILVMLWLTVSQAHSFFRNSKFNPEACNHALSLNVWNLLDHLKSEYPTNALSGNDRRIQSDLKWHEFKNKKLRDLLHYKIEDFNSTTQLDFYLQDLSFALYPSTYLKNHIEGFDSYMVAEAKRVILKKGLVNFINNSELSLKEKSSFLNRARWVLTWLSKLLPWNYTTLIYKDMSPDIAESIILNGIDSVESKELPSRNFYIEKAGTYSITLTLLASLTFAYSTYHEANVRLNQAIGGLESSLSTLENTLQNENQALEDRLVEAYVVEFEKQNHYPPTEIQKNEIRTSVHQKFFNSPQPQGEEEQQ